jgi:murein DD-endopeptidase MepM/ murein hydrolase activator NlpD
VVHLVEKGQTLWRIARAYGVSIETIVEANRLEDPTVIEVGRGLRIPGAEQVLAVEPYRPEDTREPATPEELGRGRYIWPLKGTLVSGFGKRNGRPHTGIDIGAPAGTAVRAARAGEVAYSGNGYRGYGNLVILEHGDGERTYYAHNRKNLVRQGEKVRQGATIARVGSTGRATGPHLHFEIRRGSRILDPLSRLPKR